MPKDEISTTNRETTCLLSFVQTLATHKPEYSQRADVRQSKQDGPFRLIRVSWLLLIFSPFYKQRCRSYFYNFTVKEFLSSDLVRQKLSDSILKAAVLLYVVKAGRNTSLRSCGFIKVMHIITHSIMNEESSQFGRGCDVKCWLL